MRVDDAWRELLRSHEGEPDDPWPPSPPLQQLTLTEPHDGAPIALLVGSAGSGHWSMSVEPTADGHGFSFDVACRCGIRPGRLGSEYVYGKEVSIRGEGQAVRVSHGRGDCRLQLFPAQDASCSALALDVEGVVRIQTAAEIPATARWRYTITSW